MSGPTSKKFFIVAGENSGDLHGANLVKALRKQEPDVVFRGLGGPEMERNGVELLENMVEKLAIIGFTQVVRNINKIFKLFKLVEDALVEDPPDAVILIDYPGFNLRVARLANSLDIKVIYYVVPQLWAWHASRINTIRPNVDLLLVILPFEEEYYRQRKVRDVRYTGHPLLDVIKLTRTREEVCAKFGLDAERPLIGLLPGSRKPEIIRILPTLLEACELLYKDDPSRQFVLPRATSVPESLIEKYISRYAAPIKVIAQERFNVRATFDFALVTSGTATLETTILECPMLIIYKVSWLTWLIGKALADIHYVGLPNIIAEKMIVPELLQDEATGLRIFEETKKIIGSEEKMANVKYELRRIKEKLGEPGASDKAAAHIRQLLGAS